MNDLTEFETLGAVPAVPSYVAAIVIAEDAAGRVLMQLRDDISGIAAPGKWCLFGGAIEAGESLVQSAQREFAEETGVDLAPEELRPFVRIESSATEGGVLYVYRSLRVLRPEEVVLGEGAGFAFLTLAQVRAFDTVPAIRAVLERFEAGR
ncbi:MAG: NUDIX domain-containing protein [Confluentimicrobium sp.]|jgi:8-oxo-dGTP diphosphatase|uniref:NUDIX domain-containing protein n=1 Tax=Actibacterium sp. TaxID=1872125 RepID=UPI00068E4624|nr:NUDIX domain-containing protein [Actibacterium sp.]MBC58327.1 NUDIX domain-containing protein [Actibacterium sp.]|tara:strand:+ start:1000 stop:1452 length:453 start_codon:yes stop_codon:yes gene_type:complete